VEFGQKPQKQAEAAFIWLTGIKVSKLAIEGGFSADLDLTLRSTAQVG
jgi:hypothetical protein